MSSLNLSNTFLVIVIALILIRIIYRRIKQAQDMQAQIEQVASQRYQIDMKVKELEKTLKELSAVKTIHKKI